MLLKNKFTVISSLVILIASGDVFAKDVPQITTQQLREQCGIGTSDVKTQSACVRRYANAGQSRAQLALGAMYMDGRTVDKNLEKGIELWKQAAIISQDPKIEYNVGLLFFRGSFGVEKNYKETIIWWKKATDQNFAPAQNGLGLIYQQGLGVPKDAHKAAIYYTKAARQRYPEAQNNIGVLYMNGEGVQKNDVTAFQVIQQSAYGGFSTAAYNIGYMYANGRGVKRNLIRAYGWWSVAKSNGIKNVTDETLKNLAKDFNSEQLEQAKVLSGTIQGQIQKNLASIQYEKNAKQAQEDAKKHPYGVIKDIDNDDYEYTPNNSNGDNFNDDYEGNYDG